LPETTASLYHKAFVTIEGCMLFGTARQIARGHPAVLTFVLIVFFAAQIAARGWTLSPFLKGALTAFPIGAMCGWWWAVLVVARDGVSQPGSGRWDWVFVTPPLLALIAGLAGWPTENSPVAFAIFFAIFVALTMSAKTLEKADAPDGDPSVGRMLATFLLMYLAPLGVWVLRSKIMRVAERSPLTAQA